MSPLTDKLPKELLQQIYDYVLAFDNPICKAAQLPKRSVLLDETPYFKPPDWAGKWPPSRCDITTVNTSILLACKEIYHEALPVLYQMNTICLPHDTCLTSSKSADILANIKDLVLLPPPEEKKQESQFEHLLESYTSLKTTWPKLRSITVQMDYMQDSARSNPLLQAVGRAAENEQTWPHVIIVGPGYASTIGDKKFRISSIHRLVSPLWERQVGRSGRSHPDLHVHSGFFSLEAAKWEITTLRRMNTILLYGEVVMNRSLPEFHAEWPYLEHCTWESSEFITWLLTGYHPDGLQ